jgi:hypothetical protein
MVVFNQGQGNFFSNENYAIYKCFHHEEKAEEVNYSG